MHLLCPHCQSPTEFVSVSAAGEVVCDACGSTFKVEADATLTWDEEFRGRTLGRFELLSVVGAGGFGTVYKARDPRLDRTVAVKVPRNLSLPGGQELDRFLREARATAQLRHPSIVPVYEIGQEDGLPFLVADFVEGVTLADRLTAGHPPPREAAELVAAVAEALDYAHRNGVVHRDVKPSNIMIRDDGRPVVMDFGLAKRSANEVTVTTDGQLLGTPAYMSPEQARGEGRSVDGRTDVYSLGVVLYRLLTGELPFRGNARMLLHQVIHDDPRSPRSFNDRLPRDLETVCLRAMAKEPQRRYATAGELAADLRRWLSGAPIAARPVGSLERAWRWCRRNPRVAGLLGAIAGLLATVAIGSAVAATLLGIKRDEARIAGGSALAARDDARAAARRAGEAEKTQRQELFRAYLGQARAPRASGRVGQRLRTLAIIRDILQAVPREELSAAQTAELRDEAIAALTLPDMRELDRRPSLSSAFFDVDWNERLGVYCFPDHGRRCTVVRRGDDPTTDIALPPYPPDEPLRYENRTFSPDGRWLAEVLVSSVSSRNRLRIWEWSTRRAVFDDRMPIPGVDFLAFHPAAAEAITHGANGSLLKIDLTAGKVVAESPRRFTVSPLAYALDGGRLVLANSNLRPRAIDPRTLEPVEDIPEVVSTLAVGWSPDGRSVALGTLSGQAYLWDRRREAGGDATTREESRRAIREAEAVARPSAAGRP